MYDSSKDERRVVLYITNTDDADAVRYFTDELEVKRGCRVITTSANEWADHCRVKDHISSVLLDDVDPVSLGCARDILSIFSRQRPRPVIAILVGDQDYDHLADLALSLSVRVFVHRHNEPIGCFLDTLTQGVCV